MAGTVDACDHCQSTSCDAAASCDSCYGGGCKSCCSKSGLLDQTAGFLKRVQSHSKKLLKKSKKSSCDQGACGCSQCDQPAPSCDAPSGCDAPGGCDSCGGGCGTQPSEAFGYGCEPLLKRIFRLKDRSSSCNTGTCDAPAGNCYTTPEPTCAAVAPSCGCEMSGSSCSCSSCSSTKTGLLEKLFKKKSKPAAASCGCEISTPTCGCEQTNAPCGCGAAPSCGCEVAEPTCAAPHVHGPSCGCEVAEPACSSKKGGLLDKFFTKLKKSNEPGCGAEIVAPSCGCETTHGSCGCSEQGPSCGCEMNSPSCGCEVAAPSCGCEAQGGCSSCAAEPSCGVEPSCGAEARRPIGGNSLFERLFSKSSSNAGCGCELNTPSCGCEAPPSCGCESHSSCSCGGGYGNSAPALMPNVPEVSPYQSEPQIIDPAPVDMTSPVPAPAPPQSYPQQNTVPAPLPDSKVDPFMDDAVNRIRRVPAQTIQYRIQSGESTSQPTPAKRYEEVYDPQARSAPVRMRFSDIDASSDYAAPAYVQATRQRLHEVVPASASGLRTVPRDRSRSSAAGSRGYRN